MRQNVFLGLLIVVATYLAIFSDLGKYPLKQWDESRQAVNAVEMLQRGSVIVPYFEGKPDHWSCKPTLLPNLQVLSFKAFGVNEWALRLPTALFAVLTIWLVFEIGKRIFRSSRIGFTAALILVSTRGFIRDHVTITGDHDSLLLFFTTLLLAGFWYAVHATQENTQRSGWFLFTAGLALGTLTKGIAAWLFLPALPIYLLWKGKLLSTVTSYKPWLSMLVAMTIILSYYLGRESIDPGYLQAVWENELGGRYLGSMEQNLGPPHYYLKDFLRAKFLPWWIFIPLAWWLTRRNQALFSAVIFFSLCAVVEGLVLSLAGTKLPWYDAPIYPWLSLVAAAGIWEGLDRLTRYRPFLSGKWNVQKIAWGAFLILWLIVFLQIFPQKRSQMRPSADARVGSILNEHPELDPVVISHHGYNAHNIFYQYKGEYQGRSVTKNWMEWMSPGDTLAICEAWHWEKLNEWYEYSFIYKENGPCAVVKLNARKQ